METVSGNSSLSVYNRFDRSVCFTSKNWAATLFVAVTLVIVCFSLGKQVGWAADTRTWRYVNELSQEELQKLDLRSETPRDATFPYLPAEPYPYAAPYTAEEMGLLSTDFVHMPRHNCALIEDYGTISANGYLTTAQSIGLVSYREPAGLPGQIQTKPGEWYTQWLFQAIAPAERYGRQSLYTLYRTDQTHQTRLDLFIYSPELRRVRRQPQPRRQDKALGTALGYENFLNRDAWEFRWRIIGTDILYQTVRFPHNRTSITLTAADGSLSETAPQALKIMGRDYPAYTSEGGVACYVVEARTREEWIPRYYAPKILYWLDQHTFFPLRIEEYNPNGVLTYIEDRTGHLVNPGLGNKGYEAHIFLSWDIPQDIMSYDVHDAYRPQTWTTADQQVFFSPDFLRRVWFVAPLKSQATVPNPETFFLRPLLYRDKFPHERKMEISPQLDARIRAQETAGRLVFEETP